MPVIPILLSDSPRAVEYKIHVVGQVDAEQDKLALLQRWRDYYAGNQPLLLSADQQALVDNILSKDGNYPIDNKVKTVVNKLRRRINVQGFVLPDMPATEAETAQPVIDAPANAADYAWQWWHANKMDSGERELYQCALRDGWAYIVVSHDGARPVFHVEERWDGDTGIRFFWDNDRLRRTPLYAVKTWYTKDPLLVGSNIRRVTLYTANAVYKWAAGLTDKQREAFKWSEADKDDPTLWRVQDDSDTEWPLRWTDNAGAPLGLAVVPFVAPMGSVIDGLLGLQDALNKTWVDVVANADQQGFGQFVAEYPNMLPTVNKTATGSYSPDSVTGDDGYGLRPGRILELGGGAHLLKLPADDMTGLHNTIKLITTAIASNSEMPLHYFTPLSGEVPSGAALDELAAPVGETAEELTVSFGDSWQQVMTLAQKLDRKYGAYRGEPAAVMPRWKPQPTSPETEANALQPLQAAAAAIQNLIQAGAALEGAVAVVGDMMGLSLEQKAALIRGDVEGIAQ